MISLIHAKKPRQIASGGIAFCDVITEFLFKQGYIIEKRKKGAAEMAAVNLNTEKFHKIMEGYSIRMKLKDILKKKSEQDEEWINLEKW